MPACKFLECGKGVVAWGMCDNHYRRSRKGELDVYGNYLPSYEGRGSQKWKDAISAAQKIKRARWTPEFSRSVSTKRSATQAAKWVDIECGHCHKVFKVAPHDVGVLKFCSRSCGAKGRPRRAADVLIRCQQCSVEFVCHGVHAHRKNRRFCTSKCRAVWQAKLPYKQWRGKIGASNRGKCAGEANGMYGVSPSHGKWTTVQTPTQGLVRMRSSWEVKIAEYLNSKNVGWLYEPERFKLIGKTYTPDFYIPEWGCYWEVKGWFKEKDAVKVSEFRNLYPTKPLVVVTEPVYKSILRSLPAAA